MAGRKSISTEIVEILKPFKNIIWFLFLFIAIDFFWKLFIDEGEGDQFIVLGHNFTYLTEPISLWTAKASHWVVVSLLGYKDLIINGDLLYFEGDLKIRIVWECTGIKQMIMFGILIALYFGPRKQKLWYIPVSMLFLNLINIVRIVGIVLITKDGFPSWFIGFNEWYNHRQWNGTDFTYWQFYTDWFELFHKDVFRWLYYNGIIFIIWLLWEEKYNLPFQKKKKKDEKVLKTEEKK